MKETIFKNTLILLFIFFAFNGISQEDSAKKHINKNIFISFTPTESYYIVDSINIQGNYITKKNIILRELQYTVKDTISRESLKSFIERSRENILNTSLFNFVNIECVLIQGNKFKININVIERWYLWPYPVFEFADRNFNMWLKDKDLSRINYGFYIEENNFRGKKEILRLRVKRGFNEEYSMTYIIPYFDKNQESGLNFLFAFKRTHDIPYMSIDNKLIYLKQINKYSIYQYNCEVDYSYRQGLYNSHLLKFIYNNVNISDTLKMVGPKFLNNNKDSRNIFSLNYYFKRDYRDSKSYPLNGYFFDFLLNKTGLGFLKNDKLDVAYIITSLRTFYKISNSFYYANSFDLKLSNGACQPYYIQRGLGYENDYVRGYQYYVVDGQHYGLFKSNFKYELLPTKVHNFNLLKSEKFDIIHYAIYMNLFYDIAYVKDNQFAKVNPLSNTLIYGGGVGFDFVTYYDKICRIEFSINKKGEKGIFIHLVAPI